MGIAKEEDFDGYNDHAHSWQTTFKPAKDGGIIIHKKYDMQRKNGTFIYYRKDYDIALVRLDYPVADKRTGNLINIQIIFNLSFSSNS